MSKKYHIKKDGTPGICRAKNGNCPYGDSSEHFPTIEEAQNFADKRNERLDNRNKLACQFVENRSFELERCLYNLCDNIDKVSDKDYFKVKIKVDNDNILIQKSLEIDLAKYSYDKINTTTVVNIRLDPDNLEKIKVEVARENNIWKNSISTPSGGLRSITKNETERLEKIEKKIKNRILRNKEKILEASFDGNNFIYNNIEDYKGKTVTETIDSIDDDKWYVIVNKQGKEVSEGRKSNKDLDKSYFNNKINNIKIEEPGGEEEKIYLYI